MSRLVFLLVLVSVLALPASAQRAAGSRPNAEQVEARLDARVAELGKALDLTDAQGVALKTLLAEQAREMMALRSAGSRPDRAQMQALRRGHEQALEALLTPEQVEKYRAFVEKERAEAPRRGRRGNG